MLGVSAKQSPFATKRERAATNTVKQLSITLTPFYKYNVTRMIELPDFNTKLFEFYKRVAQMPAENVEIVYQHLPAGERFLGSNPPLPRKEGFPHAELVEERNAHHASEESELALPLL